MLNSSANAAIRAGNLGKRSFSTAYATLALFRSGPRADLGAGPGNRADGARFELDDDLSPLFPYINAVADQARYYEKPVYIRFLFADRLCALYPRQGAFAPVQDLADAMGFLRQLLDYIAEVAVRSPRIVPNYKLFKPGSALDIYRLLPGSNCRTCGYATCMAFAAALSRQYTSIVKCPYLARPMEERATFPVYDDQGKLFSTVSLNIDTAGMRQTLDRKDALIKALESRLADYEKNRSEKFDAANARLPAPLSQREVQVLRRMACGATNKEISRALHISEHTVKSHVIHIFNKLGVDDRAQASAWGALNGLILDLPENH